MAIILDEENNVVTVENQPEAKRTLFKNISDGNGGAIDKILERLDHIYPGTNAGFISSTGAIQGATADAEVYTDEFPATPGNKVSVTLKYTQDRSMWLAYCLYGADHTFISRTMLVNSVTQKAASVSFTVPEGAYYCRLTYRSFNDATATIDTTGQRLNDVQVGGKSIVKNGVAYIPSADAEVIADITTTENLETLTVDTDSEGNAFNLREAHIIVLFPASTTGANSVIVAKSADSDSGDYYSYGTETLRGDASCVIVHDYVSHGAYFDIGLFKNDSIGGPLTAMQKVAYINASKSIQSFVLEQYSSSTTLIPSGTRVIVYGVRV